MKPKPAVSLSFELSEILDAVEGLRLLAEPLQEGVGEDDLRHHKLRAVAGVIAGLSMIGVRLRQVLLALRGDLDPFGLIATHNVVPGNDPLPDVVLKPWSPEQAAGKASEHLALAEHRQAKARAKRRTGRRS